MQAAGYLTEHTTACFQPLPQAVCCKNIQHPYSSRHALCIHTQDMTPPLPLKHAAASPCCKLVLHSLSH